MKRIASLLITGAICLMLAACDGAADNELASQQVSSESQTVEEQQLSSNPQQNESTDDKSTDGVFPVNEIVEAMIEEYENPPLYRPAWSDAKPEGINLHYGETTVQAPVKLSADRGTSGCAIYVSEAATGIAYCIEQKVNPVTILTSGDMGQTWQTYELNVEGIEKYDYYYLTYANQNNGLFLMTDADGECQLFRSEDAGSEWNFAGTFIGPDEIHYLHATDDAIFIAGKMSGYPAVLKSENGIEWVSVSLPVDTTAYVSGQGSQIEFRDGVGLVAATVYSKDGSWSRQYFASDDGGEKWAFYETGR